MKEIQKIAVQYLDGVMFPQGSSTEDNDAMALTLQAEVMRLGYLFTKEAYEKLCGLNEMQMRELYCLLVPVLRDLKGADKTWKPMYPKFPKQVLKASALELYGNALCHYWTAGQWLPDYPNSKRLPKLEQIKYTYLKAVGEGDVLGVFTELLGSNASLSASSKEDLIWFLDTYGERLQSYVPDAIPFKEQLAYFVGYCISAEMNMADKAVKTATDVLRVMAVLSGGDVSLAEPVKFKSWRRSERRAIVSMLENVIYADDIARYGERWKRAFHGLHVGDYSRVAPKVYRIASQLRGGKLRTFYSKVEEAIVSGDVGAIDALLSTRPGELARRLDHLLRILDRDAAEVLLDRFASVAGSVDTRVLLQLYGHMWGRGEVVSQRVILPKGNQAKARVLNSSLPALPGDQVAKLLEIIRGSLVRKFGQYSDLGTVWIDPALKKCPVPMEQRSASDSLRAVARGTRLPLGDEAGAKNTLRMFIWWVGQDVDLSCVLYDSGFHSVGQISYTNVRCKWIDSCHSGDIVHAPKGAAEFIDIDMGQALRAGVRYVAMNVLDYTGLKFVNYRECFAGWMTREYPNANEIYDPKTVEQKVDLRTNTRLAQPVVFDLQEREAVWLDLNGRVAGRLPNNVESNAATIVDLMKAALMLSEKVSLFDLFEMHAEARGKLVEKREDAESVFSLDEGVTPFDIAKIASGYMS